MTAEFCDRAAPGQPCRLSDTQDGGVIVADENESDHAGVDTTAAMVMLRSEMTSLLEFCNAICREVGIQSIEGLSISDWYQRQRDEDLRSALVGLEDLDPALAAVVQYEIDGAIEDARVMRQKRDADGGSGSAGTENLP